MQKIEHILIAQQLDRIHSESIELIHHEKIEGEYRHLRINLIFCFHRFTYSVRLS
jgi:hypothetical protein